MMNTRFNLKVLLVALFDRFDLCVSSTDPVLDLIRSQVLPCSNEAVTDRHKIVSVGCNRFHQINDPAHWFI